MTLHLQLIWYRFQTKNSKFLQTSSPVVILTDTQDSFYDIAIQVCHINGKTMKKTFWTAVYSEFY